MNLQNLAAQAMKAQKELEKKQQIINEKLFPGKSEMVEIVLNGKKEIVSLDIDKTKFVDIDDVDILEDMLMIAMKDALSKVDKETESQFGSIKRSLGGLF